MLLCAWILLGFRWFLCIADSKAHHEAWKRRVPFNVRSRRGAGSQSNLDVGFKVSWALSPKPYLDPKEPPLLGFLIMIS